MNPGHSRLWVASGLCHDQSRPAGDEGSDPGRFDLPHGIALDSPDCLHVTDTMNYRIQEFAVG
jgi:hypothetical protein